MNWPESRGFLLTLQAVSMSLVTLLGSYGKDLELGVGKAKKELQSLRLFVKVFEM